MEGDAERGETIAVVNVRLCLVVTVLRVLPAHATATTFSHPGLISRRQGLQTGETENNGLGES